jgi:hypothetical protein
MEIFAPLAEGEGKGTILECFNLSPSPQPSPVEGEGVISIFYGFIKLGYGAPLYKNSYTQPVTD